MEAFGAWVASTWLAGLVIHHPRLWPIAETFHFVGMSLLIGVVGALDLRLLGLMRGIPVRALLDLMPWAIAGFLVNLVTGTVFFFGASDQYIGNVAFYMKMLFIIVAGINAAVFQLFLLPVAQDAGGDGDVPLLAKIVAGASLVCWFGVLYCGRMLPYLGQTF